MKFNLLLPRLVASFAALVVLAPAVAQTARATPTARVIVKYNADSPLLRRETLAAGSQRVTAREALAQRMGLALRAGADVGERAQVVLASGLTSQQLAARLARESDVEYAVPDYRRHRVAVPNDALYFSGSPITGISGGPTAGQWYLRPPTTELRSAINVETAWNYTIGSPSIVVADIDTGVRFDHPDLMRVANGGNMLPGYDMIQDPEVANDGDGRDPDPSDPGDWLTQAEITQNGGAFEDCADSPENSSWHGTQTAGLIAALTNNGIGMASVGRKVRLLPVRALGKCGGYDSDIVASIRWAAGLIVAGVPSNPNPARVINMSLGGAGPCTQPYVNAIAEARALGVVVVAAAGNSAGHSVISPANCPGVIAVAGLRHAGTKVGFSDLGPEIAISAPAGNCVDIGANDPCRYPILTTSNSGAMNPVSNSAGGSIYSDAFDASVGTSFSAPLVAGTAALMLSVQPGLSPSGVRALLESTARPFPTTGAEEGSGPIPQCTVPQFSGGTPVDQLQCYCNTAVCGAGMLDAGAAVAAALGIGPTLNFQGIWWNAPAGSESGWGISFAHQGDTIFAAWYTYDAGGRAYWLTMTAVRTGPNTYAGKLYENRGPPLNTAFNPGAVQQFEVGDGTLTFSDADHGTFRYTVNGITQTKTLVRLVFGPLPTCTWGAQANLALATNYQDMWWVIAGAELGWGVNFTHQGDIIFVAWFAYDLDGKPLWLWATTNKSAPGVYTGTIHRNSGPAFSAANWNPLNVVDTPVGSLTITFANGNRASFHYTLNLGTPPVAIDTTKMLERFVFQAPGTVCN